MFGGAMFNDPFFGGNGMQDQMTMMNQMMQNSFQMMGQMTQSPFAPVMAMGAPLPITDGRAQRQTVQAPAHANRRQQVATLPQAPVVAMNPFQSFMGGGLFNNLHQQMGGAQSDPNSHFYSQSTVMSYSNTGQGAPTVYQATSSTRQTPGGVKEVKKSVRDSRVAVEKMSVGRYIGDRGHVMERERHTRSGDLEQNEEYVNLDEDDYGEFDREWQDHTQHYSHGPDRRGRSRGNRAVTDGRARYDHRDRSNLRQPRPPPAIGYRERE